MDDTSNHTASFREAMAREGIVYTGEIVGDGTLHRFHVEGDPRGKKNGFYTLFLDDRPAGNFGCNKRFGTEHKFSWKAEGMAPMSAEERIKLAEAIEARREEGRAKEALRQADAAVRAKRMWDQAAEAVDHPYLTRKGLDGPHGARMGRWIKTRHDGTEWVAATNALLVPVRYGKEIVGLQAIFAEPIKIGEESRGKEFVYGARKTGCWFPIGKLTLVAGVETLLLCEGYATGVSAHIATGMGVIVAFDAGNLEPVAEELARRRPGMRIVVLADNDRWTKQPIDNPGVYRARQAAEAVDGEVVVPQFADLRGEPTDFNDLHVREGVDEVRHQIMVVVERQQSEPGKTGTREIVLSPAARPEALREVDAALAAQRPRVVFQSGQSLVRIVDAEGKLKIHELTAADLVTRIDEAVRLTRPTPTGNKATHCPAWLATNLLANFGHWKVARLVGLSEIPILDIRSGAVRDVAGYDPTTEIYYSGAAPLLELPSVVTPDQARRAADKLLSPFSEFPWASAACPSVALSYLLTGIIRGQLKTAPMFLFSASSPGAGKGLLIDCLNLILFGQPPRTFPPLSGSFRDEEERKRITAMLASRSASVHIDNCVDVLGSGPLNSLLTMDSWTDRTLGKSEQASYPTRVLIAASGNNLTPSADLVRRSLRLSLLPGVEAPEMRSFAVPDLRRHVLSERRELLSCGYSILRGYIQAGAPRAPGAPLGSFEDWSGIIRGAILWVGLADPLISQVAMRDEDPVLTCLDALYAAWPGVFGGEWVGAGQLARSADPSLRAALDELCQGQPSSTKIGMELRKYKDHPVGGRVLRRRADKHKKGSCWRVEDLGSCRSE